MVKELSHFERKKSRLLKMAKFGMKNRANSEWGGNGLGISESEGLGPN
jgi:hypothetical protein